MKKLLLSMLIGSCFFSYAESGNIFIEKEKFEVVIVDGVETIFETGTLKPVMIFEEVIKITNIAERDLEYVIYDFKLDKKSVLHENLDLGPNIEILYSNNDGLSYSAFPIVEDGENIDMEDYTDIRMTIDRLYPEEYKNLRVRYSYDHFAQGE